MTSSAEARVFPAQKGEFNFNAQILRNLDQFNHHWGAGFGYCWLGRLNANLEWREDGILGEDLFPLFFVGLDFYWERRISLGFELNVNQDFRYHALDVKLGYHW